MGQGEVLFPLLSQRKKVFVPVDPVKNGRAVHRTGLFVGRRILQLDEEIQEAFSEREGVEWRCLVVLGIGWR